MSENTELIILQDEFGNKLKLVNFKDNFRVLDGKILVLKYNLVSKPRKQNKILMVTAGASTTNETKVGIGKIIRVGTDIKDLKFGDIVVFNKWNQCTELTSGEQIYYVVKKEDVHSTLNLDQYTEEQD